MGGERREAAGWLLGGRAGKGADKGASCHRASSACWPAATLRSSPAHSPIPPTAYPASKAGGAVGHGRRPRHRQQGKHVAGGAWQWQQGLGEQRWFHPTVRARTSHVQLYSCRQPAPWPVIVSSCPAPTHGTALCRWAARCRPSPSGPPRCWPWATPAGGEMSRQMGALLDKQRPGAAVAAQHADVSTAVKWVHPLCMPPPHVHTHAHRRAPAGWTRMREASASWARGWCGAASHASTRRARYWRGPWRCVGGARPESQWPCLLAARVGLWALAGEWAKREAGAARAGPPSAWPPPLLTPAPAGRVRRPAPGVPV